MNKITFADGTKIQEAYVTIDGQNHNVTPAVWSGTVPLSAQNLNKMQDNIEEAIEEATADVENIVKVSTQNPLAEIGDKLNTGYNYKVGNNSLEVYYCGVKLQKDVDYEESGSIGETSMWIKALVPFGYLDMSGVEGFENFEETMEFVIRGDYS